jgi:hypothetical protein
MVKGVMSDQNRGQMSSGVLKASDRQRNFIKRETLQCVRVLRADCASWSHKCLVGMNISTTFFLTCIISCTRRNSGNVSWSKDTVPSYVSRIPLYSFLKYRLVSTNEVWTPSWSVCLWEALIRLSVYVKHDHPCPSLVQIIKTMNIETRAVHNQRLWTSSIAHS